MSLAGLSVDAWLDRHADGARCAPPVVPFESRHEPRAPRRRLPLATLTGFVAGVVLAVPALTAQTACPPAGEGAVHCYLQDNVLRAVMTVLLVMLAARLIAGIPALVSRARSGHLLPRVPPPAARYDDPILWAATRGHVG